MFETQLVAICQVIDELCIKVVSEEMHESYVVETDGVEGHNVKVIIVHEFDVVAWVDGVEDRIDIHIKIGLP